MQTSDELRKSNDSALMGLQPKETVEGWAYGVIEAIRPIRSSLCHRDICNLQDLMRQCAHIDGGVFPLLSLLLRAKLQDATLMREGERTAEIATVGSRVLYAINGTAPKSGTIYYEGFAAGQGGIPVKTLLGVTLLGMRIGQTTPLLWADGTRETLELVGIPWQPGHA